MGYGDSALNIKLKLPAPSRRRRHASFALRAAEARALGSGRFATTAPAGANGELALLRLRRGRCHAQRDGWGMEPQRDPGGAAMPRSRSPPRLRDRASGFRTPSRVTGLR